MDGCNTVKYVARYRKAFMKEKEIGFIIKQISDKLKSRADNSFQKHDLTLAQVKVLGFIARSGGCVTQKSIEEHLQVSHPTVVGIVKRLEEKAFLSCTIGQQDKRNKIVSLTEKAVLLGDILKKEKSKTDEILTELLSASEQQLLRDFLTRMYDNVEGRETC